MLEHRPCTNDELFSKVNIASAQGDKREVMVTGNRLAKTMRIIKTVPPVVTSAAKAIQREGRKRGKVNYFRHFLKDFSSDIKHWNKSFRGIFYLPCSCRCRWCRPRSVGNTPPASA